MANHQQWITLDSIIYDYISESEQSETKYFKLFHIAFRGMDALGLDAFYQIKTVKLPVNANKTVTLPNDYINYSKIGILNNVGEVVPLYFNSKITKYADLMPNRVEQTTDNNNGGFDWNAPNGYLFYNYWYGGAYQNIYGMPSGAPFAGSFNIDNTNGVIVLDPHTHLQYIMLEYLASPKEGETYYVPVQFREALLAWIAWRDIINLPPSQRRGFVTDKAAKRNEFYNERRLAIARYKPLRRDEAYYQNLENQRLTVKG